VVYADYFVIGARSEVAPIWGESHGVYGTQMVAHVAKLSGLCVGLVVGVVDGLGRPDPNMAI
jgi:hypothetical protein